MLVIALFASDDAGLFFEYLRDVIETPLVMQCEAALLIVRQIYVWIGLRLKELLKMGMTVEELEELRGLAIKYLESHELFDEEQR